MTYDALDTGDADREITVVQTSYEDKGEDPSNAGDMQRNGTDVKVHTGGGVKNLTDLAANVPTNAIVIWSGAIADIPSGWVLCDGNNSTPNLQDKFVVGAGSTHAVDATGGESTHTLTSSELASHTHSIPYGNNTAGLSSWVMSSDDAGSTSTINTNGTGGDSAHENKPPFHALAYIMKT